jgi:hypothetical protein
VRIAGWAILTMVAAPGCRQIFGIDDTEVATTTVDGPSPIIDAELPDSPPSPPDAPLTDCGLLYVAVAGADPGHTYRARPSGAPWGMAQNSCVADGAYLVIIDDAEEELAIRAFVPDDPSSPFFWVGVTDAMAEGTYVTSLGAAATYLPWAPGQPTGAAEDCVLLADLGGFSDWNCDGPQSYACECGSN